MEFEKQSKDQPAADGNQGKNEHQKLHIFINTIKYENKDGVKSQMYGWELAALIPLDKTVAEITKLHPHEEQIGIDQLVPIKNGDQFQIIRNNVKGGYNERN